ncbi:hypothetical protein [Streptomyces sp. SID12488]|nr:hypothetical protein [Streptomyces sp. SID12488]NEA65120.1 hypothetical protein [Streptomyces sp. SID12488]
MTAQPDSHEALLTLVALDRGTGITPVPIPITIPTTVPRAAVAAPDPF